MLKKVVIYKPGSWEQLKIETFDSPKPKSNEVLIEVYASGVNFADCCVRLGVYSSAEKYVGWPITPGFEVSGKVLEKGDGVSEFEIGQNVIAITRFGGYASRLTVPADQIFPVPSGVSLIEAAGLPAIFLTAYYAMHELAHPRKNALMLVHSAAGGVGSSLVQLGKTAGCRVAGVVGAPHKVNAVKKLGADFVVDKSSEDLWKCLEKYAPEGFDAVFDANGPETLKESYNHLSPGGKLVVYGFHTMLRKGKGSLDWLKAAWGYLTTPRFNPLNMTGDNHSVLAFNLSYLFDQNWMLQEGMRHIINLIEQKMIKSPTVKSYPIEYVQQAHKDLESGNTIGKLVLTFDQQDRQKKNDDHTNDNSSS